MTPATPGDPVSSLVRSLRAPLCRVARGEGLDPQEAFDCAQEAFLLLLSSPSAPPPDQARGFLVASARNLARNRRRSHSVARPHLPGEALDDLPSDLRDAESLLHEAEQRKHLLACVHRLERLQRAVVTLRMLDERPGESVAAELGLSPGHTAVLLHRAKAALRRCLEAPAAHADEFPLTHKKAP